MNPKIKATFVRRSFHDSGRDQAPDYYIYEFTSVVDDKGKKYNDKWIKETKLMKAVKFEKGKEYSILLSRSPFSLEAVNLPYPVEVACDGERVYMKGGNSIIREDKTGNKKNLSVPINKLMGISNYDTAAVNKFGKGLMTKELLLKMNERGIYFYVHYSDPQDRRKSKQYGYGYTKKSDKGNYILVQKETQKEIDDDLRGIRSNYVPKAIEEYFKIITEILPAKEKRKK